MKTSWWILALAVSLTACQKAERAETVAGKAHRDRFAGVGIYSPGAMWTQLARPAAASDASAATLEDDEEVIVVIDTATGEIRQCGNLSGHCLTLDPWSKSASVQGAPAPLLKHARDLAREAEERAKAEANAR